MHFCQSKINKMWNYCLKLWFFRNCLLQRLETCSIGISMPWTLNTCHSSHFWCIFPSQNNKMWNFGCFLNSPWQKTEKLQFAQRKSVCKSAHIGFLGMPIAMHYVRTMCDKYFLSYYGLSAFFYGKVKILGYETWCRGKMGPKEDCCICPIPFSWFWTPCSVMCLLKLWFFMNC